MESLHLSLKIRAATRIAWLLLRYLLCIQSISKLHLHLLDLVDHHYIEQQHFDRLRMVARSLDHFMTKQRLQFVSAASTARLGTVLNSIAFTGEA